MDRRDRAGLSSEPAGRLNTIANALAHELEDALDDLERDYFYGEISREEWSDRRNRHIAWFAERGIGEDAVDADE